jgi:broad specificity phosphatase PhoE
MAARVHLVRHGETHNPRHVVYADLDGYHLNDHGLTEAASTAVFLADRPIAAVWTSPLDRARETAEIVAAPHGLVPRLEPDLVEWRLANGWAGIVWEDLPVERPGELEAYLDHPWDLPFSAESLDELARRVAAVAERAAGEIPDGEVIVVTHQDPVQSARLYLTGGSLRTLQQDKPGHASVTMLAPGSPWSEVGYHEPDTGVPPRRFPPVDD